MPEYGFSLTRFLSEYILCIANYVNVNISYAGFPQILLKRNWKFRFEDWKMQSFAHINDISESSVQKRYEFWSYSFEFHNFSDGRFVLFLQTPRILM